jgi:hypothetical protein
MGADEAWRPRAMQPLPTGSGYRSIPEFEKSPCLAKK